MMHGIAALRGRARVTPRRAAREPEGGPRDTVDLTGGAAPCMIGWLKGVPRFRGPAVQEVQGTAGPGSLGADPYWSDESSWNPLAEAQLEAFLDRCRQGLVEHPVAVFDFDGTLCKDDIGEGFLRWLIANRKLQGVDYSQDIYGQYEEALHRDHAAGYAFAVQLMDGIEEEELKGWARDFARDFVPAHVFPKQRELVGRLQEAGADVHIVSASNRWLVEAAGPLLGVPADHTVGIQTRVRDGKLTREIVPPITYREGKVEAIRRYIGDKVDFAAGNAWTDFEMCQFAGQMALMINPEETGPVSPPRGDGRGGCPDSLFCNALARGWAVQKWGA